MHIVIWFLLNIFFSFSKSIFLTWLKDLDILVWKFKFYVKNYAGNRLESSGIWNPVYIHFEICFVLNRIMGLPRILPRNQSISRKLHWNGLDMSDNFLEFPGNVREVFWTCPGKFREDISWTFSRNVQEINRKRPGHFRKCSRSGSFSDSQSVLFFRWKKQGLSVNLPVTIRNCSRTSSDLFHKFSQQSKGS